MKDNVNTLLTASILCGIVSVDQGIRTGGKAMTKQIYDAAVAAETLRNQVYYRTTQEANIQRAQSPLGYIWRASEETRKIERTQAADNCRLAWERYHAQWVD